MPPLFHNLARALRSAARKTASRRTGDEGAEFCRIIREHGLSYVSSGAFGSVFVKKEVAVKIVRQRGAQAYLAYARMCRRQHATNPLLPRVYSVLTIGRHAIVFMERLHMYLFGQRLDRRRVCDAMDIITSTGPFTLPGKQQAIRRCAVLLRRRQTGLRGAFLRMRDIRQKHPGARWDLHRGNIMFRWEKGVYRGVLTDPLAG